ncbi:hypothetical protein NA56DRAFT_438340 [Hyaloscypha hepaticicola]|uniref:F-box domain-containing protein n=1 Tax=Hyaloscypha hepaticicola TaxID=2082293 RepID=A0A2J6QH13_9HELO|nr:hypothetical protein NA56DRAFT_438340 [Hyaloscypha hepaticicola]
MLHRKTICPYSPEWTGCRHLPNPDCCQFLSSSKWSSSIFLPPNDLLRVQRVCRLWKDTTEHSLALQKKLFFQPISDTSREAELNTLLQDVFPQFLDLYSDHWHKYVASPEDFALINWFNNPARRDRILRPEASWRRIHPIQPPTMIQYVVLEISCTCFYERDKGLVIIFSIFRNRVRVWDFSGIW